VGEPAGDPLSNERLVRGFIVWLRRSRLILYLGVGIAIVLALTVGSAWRLLRNFLLALLHPTNPVDGAPVWTFKHRDPSMRSGKITIQNDPGLSSGSAWPRQRKGERDAARNDTVENVDRFIEVFSTDAAEKRKKHGSKGAAVFRDPCESDRVWGVFDWDEQGWQRFVSDPDVPPLLATAGVKGRLQRAELVGSFDA
jgi:hypothetical protein